MHEAADRLVLLADARARRADRHELELRDRELNRLAADDDDTAAATGRFAHLVRDRLHVDARKLFRVDLDRALDGGAVERGVDGWRRADVIEKEERDRAEAKTLAIADRHHRSEAAVFDVRAVRRPEVA